MPLRSLISSPRRPAEPLLLDVAEALHASALPARAVAQRVGEPAKRVRDALAALQAEGLIASAEPGLGRASRYHLTAAGADALAARGRFPGEVAVLFTDLVASTELIAAHGELGAHERRLRHLALLRAAVLRAGGYEVKGLGDGLMVAFRDAATAARCAIDMQRAVAADTDGLGLRVGIHAGTVLRDGDDLHGSTVITAARLCDQAGAGETLVSEQVLAGTGDGRGAFAWQPEGERKLKGLAEPVVAYRLSEPVATSRRRERPASSAVDRRPRGAQRLTASAA